jgi:hypothetical protein
MCFEQLGEAECRTALMAFRAELTTGAAASAQDVPKMMCQILQQLIQDRNTVKLIRYKNSLSTMRHRQNTTVLICYNGQIHVLQISNDKGAQEKIPMLGRYLINYKT